MRWWESSSYLAQKRMWGRFHTPGSELDRKFWIALVLYGVLGLLVWFTVGGGKILVDGRLVEIRLIPLIVIGGLALRTVVAHHAAQIRREDGKR